MLYIPWRNEKKDLLKDFETYQDRFETVKRQIEENSKQYENHSEVIDSAVEEIESEESNAIVAPDAQYQDE
jgi:predicted  nucleic acid-binding Zn-ribbon protein